MPERRGNTELLVRGQVVEQGQRIAMLRSTIHSVDDQLLAEAESKWFFPKGAMLQQITGMDEATLQQFFDKTSPK